MELSKIFARARGHAVVPADAAIFAEDLPTKARGILADLTTRMEHMLICSPSYQSLAVLRAQLSDYLALNSLPEKMSAESFLAHCQKEVLRTMARRDTFVRLPNPGATAREATERFPYFPAAILERLGLTAAQLTNHPKINLRFIAGFNERKHAMETHLLVREHHDMVKPGDIPGEAALAWTLDPIGRSAIYFRVKADALLTFQQKAPGTDHWVLLLRGKLLAELENLSQERDIPPLLGQTLDQFRQHSAADQRPPAARAAAGEA